MRRLLAIGLAIIVVTLGARGAAAEDSPDVSERLLEILKDRQLISEDEYGELKALAKQMSSDREEVGERLTDLDRSISDYLAQGGSAATGANVAYKKRDGFGLMTGDGLFATYVGGLFQFGYSGMDFTDLGGVNDSNSFDVVHNRFSFLGHAFDPDLRYYVEFDADGVVFLLDAFVDYDWESVGIRAGQYKAPFGRQAMAYEGDLAFFSQGPVSGTFDFGRDVGVMLWDIMEMDGNETVVEWYAHIGNGDGGGSSANEGQNLQYALRAGVYPMGYVGNPEDRYGRNYVEGNMDAADDPRVGLAASYLHNKTSNTGSGALRGGGGTVRALEVDGVFTMGGIYLTGEWFDTSFNPTATPSGDADGYYLQGGFMVPNSQIEVVGRFGTVDFDEDLVGTDKMTEWSLGAVYYWDGHLFKVGAFFSHARTSVVPTKNFDVDALSIVFQMDW